MSTTPDTLDVLLALHAVITRKRERVAEFRNRAAFRPSAYHREVWIMRANELDAELPALEQAAKVLAESLRTVEPLKVVSSYSGEPLVVRNPGDGPARPALYKLTAESAAKIRTAVGKFMRVTSSHHYSESRDVVLEHLEPLLDWAEGK